MTRGKRFVQPANKRAYVGKHFKRPEDYLDAATQGSLIEASRMRVSKPERTEGSPSVGRSTAIMSIATLLSRVTGFGRTWAMGYALGVTALSSAYVVANNVPNMLYELIAGGILTTAFLPIYLKQLKLRGRRHAAAYTSNILSLALIALGLVALLATIFAPQLIWLQTFLGKDFDLDRAVFFFRFFSIQIVIYGIGAIINGLLNAHRAFLWPALGPVFNNVVVMITFIGYPFIAASDPDFGYIWLSVGTTLGVVVLFAVQLPALARLKIPLRPRIDLKDPALKDTFKLAGPAVIFVVMGVLAVMAMNNFASFTGDSGPATISFAQLWYFLPYGVIAVALSTALLTEMSEASAVADWAKFRHNVRMGLRTTLFLIIPLAAIIFIMADQFVVLFRFGAFSAESVSNVSAVLSVWCFALPFYAAYMFIYRAFSAMRQLIRFVIFDSIGRVLLIGLYAMFTMGFMAVPKLGLIGIPLAEICINIALCSVMLYQLRKKIGSFGLTQIVGDGVKLLIAATMAVAPAFAFLFFVEVSEPGISLGIVAAFGILSLLLYYLMCRLLKIPEVRIVQDIGAKVLGRMKRGQ